jgi:hypothetical protein
MQLKKIFLLFLGVTSSYKAMAVILSDLDKKNLINAMHDVKNAAATLNESRKLSTTSDSVHTTDTACRAIVEKIFSSPETLAYFVNHRTINEMESITRSNASEKLNELYANFFKREHILSFIKTELSPKKADILVKEKSYKMHDLTDFIKAIEKEDQKKDTHALFKNAIDGIALYNEAGKQDSYNRAWEAVLREFQIDYAKWLTPEPEAYVTFVKLVCFFKGFLTENRQLISDNLSSFECFFHPLEVLREISSERKAQSDWLCGPGYRNRFMLGLLTLLRQKVYFSFAEEFTLPEIESILSKDEYLALFSENSNFKIFSDFLTPISAEDLEKSYMEIQKEWDSANQEIRRENDRETEREKKRVADETEEEVKKGRNGDTARQTARKNQDVRLRERIIKVKEEKKQIISNYQKKFKNNIVCRLYEKLTQKFKSEEHSTLFQHALNQTYEELHKKYELQKINQHFSSLTLEELKDAVKIANQVMKEAADNLQAHREDRDLLVSDLCNKLKQNKHFSQKSMEMLYTWEDFKSFLLHLELYLASKTPKINPTIEQKSQNLVSPFVFPQQITAPEIKKEQKASPFVFPQQITASEIKKEQKASPIIQSIADIYIKEDLKIKATSKNGAQHYIDAIRKRIKQHSRSLDALKEVRKVVSKSIGMLDRNLKTFVEGELRNGGSNAINQYFFTIVQNNQHNRTCTPAETTVVALDRTVLDFQKRENDTAQWISLIEGFAQSEKLNCTHPANQVLHYIVHASARNEVVWESISLREQMDSLSNKNASFFLNLSPEAAEKLYLQLEKKCLFGMGL